MARNMIIGELYTTSQLASYWTGLTVKHKSLSVQLLILQYRDLSKFYLIAMPFCSLLDGVNNQSQLVTASIMQYSQTASRFSFSSTFNLQEQIFFSYFRVILHEFVSVSLARPRRFFPRFLTGIPLILFLSKSYRQMLVYITILTLQLDLVLCHSSAIKFQFKKQFLTFSQLLVAGPEYITFGDLNILETG